MEGSLKKTKNVHFKSPSAVCQYCNARIRDWKLYCNQRCYDKQQDVERMCFETESYAHVADEHEYNSMYFGQNDVWSEEMCPDQEDHEHPIKKRDFSECEITQTCAPDECTTQEMCE